MNINFDLGSAITEGLFWLIPVITIFFSSIFKIVDSDGMSDAVIKIFDFGPELIISSMLVLVSEFQSITTVYLLVFYFFMCLVALLVRRKSDEFEKIIVCDFIGVFMILLTIAHVGILKLPNISIHIEHLVH